MYKLHVACLMCRHADGGLKSTRSWIEPMEVKQLVKDMLLVLAVVK